MAAAAMMPHDAESPQKKNHVLSCANMQRGGATGGRHALLLLVLGNYAPIISLLLLVLGRGKRFEVMISDLGAGVKGEKLLPPVHP
jgi:hypothetical protein